MVEKGTEDSGKSKKRCKAEGRPIYTAMSETDTAIAASTIRALKNKHYRYI